MYMKRIINKLLRKIFWLLLPLIKENYMSKSIDDLIKNSVLKNIKHIHSTVKITVEDDIKIHSKLFIVNLNDGTEFSFRLNFDENGVRYEFVNTNIKDLYMLTTILNTLNNSLMMYTVTIEKYFYANLVNTGQNTEKFKMYSTM